MDPLEYLITVMSKIERLSKLIEVEEEQAADWLVRATAFEEQIVMGMGRGGVWRSGSGCV